ncbi:hypothetical protein BO70DRAFT_365902 [Aspergillus heteromorphus CBS 117.55]|uniref:DUF1275 domain protein n=1 Tax=Aspergillus heteromorphus CBS 117.55 TaxID=1448321 RepID=A0A317V750_9EURO|nr:uncharacterized protein BO70DRAFT_365902 [Aspergillus heteromorphus CBS 117.55]PWY69091.1 hypothetical protein BO70DRAFT_365902 [Aspergillus heteromorphus CBS 117.55]
MARETPRYQPFPAQESDPLLGPRYGAKDSPLSRLRRHLRTEVNPRRGDLLLICCYVITGLLDSAAVFIWGSFVSMQTGNTVYFGLGLAGLDETQRWLKSLISIGSFCVGSFAFAWFHRLFRSPRQRAALALSFTLQTVCVAVAATIVTLKQTGRDDLLSWKIAVPLALVAFQSSGQAVTSRVLRFSSLTSVVLTSIYCDLFSYPELMSTNAIKDPDEWRRVGAVLGLLLGTLLGGSWAKSAVGLPGALWTAVVLKGMIAMAWLWWRGADETERQEE